MSLTITNLIAGTRFSHLDEASLQASIAALIQAEHPSLKVEREVKIGDGERIDLLVGDTLGIEVNGSAATRTSSSPRTPSSRSGRSTSQVRCAR